ncbi:MAG: response regulator transcription factor [Ruminococcaceae bacterium]|nr:response regulator transcription factor [Oscillospiraceae bacterium]
MSRLLLADDERDLANAIGEILRHEDYEVDLVFNGADALSYALTGNYDCVILDIMMPKVSGLDVLANMRSHGVRTPVLILSAKGQLEDKLKGLDLGADDYITKPFETAELLARIRVILRRQSDYTPDILQFGKLILNRSSYELSYEDRVTTLGNKEFQLMEIFMTRPKNVISTVYMMDHVWAWDSDLEMNVVWVYISHLRKKLRSINADVEIRSKRGVGYSLEETFR